ncbi:MAG: hypothetical protein AB7S38_39730 [Vulcanimicrobiota bacterium]
MRFLARLILLLLLTAWPVWAVSNSMDGTAEELNALKSLEQQKLIDLREQARAIIQNNPQSVPGHYLMGYSLHHSEGDLPRSKFHLERARKLFRQQYGPVPAFTTPWGWYERTLSELEMVNGEMDLYQEQLDILDDYLGLTQALFSQRPPQILASYAWPLMKLGKEQEARRRLEDVSQYRDEITRSYYWNTLGALEMETGHPQASYEAFSSLIVEIERNRWTQTCTYLRNTGEAAAAIGRFDDAERNFLEASRYFDPYSFSNPWWDLTALYLTQGRFAEAVSALQKTHEWSFASRPFLAQQSWAANQHITCETLLQIGETEKATEIARRFVSRPDRQGGDSVHRDQWEAGNLMMYRTTLLARAESLDEERSWSRGLHWWKLMFEARKLRSEARLVGTRAAAIAAGNDRISKSIRYSYAPGTVMMPNWQRPELVSLYGAGTTAVAIQEVIDSKPESLTLELPYLQVMEAEVQAQQGDREEAITTLEGAIANLPASENTLRARALATQGKLLEAEGRYDEANARFQKVLDTVPGMIRFLDISLPVTIDDSGNSKLSRVRKMLLRSPRFHRGQGLDIKLTTTGASLMGTVLDNHGTVVARAEVKVEGDLDENLRSLAAEIHRKTFAPKINLSQKDLNSLDGSNLTGSTRTEELKDQFMPGTDGPRI